MKTKRVCGTCIYTYNLKQLQNPKNWNRTMYRNYFVKYYFLLNMFLSSAVCLSVSIIYFKSLGSFRVLFCVGWIIGISSVHQAEVIRPPDIQTYVRTYTLHAQRIVLFHWLLLLGTTHWIVVPAVSRLSQASRQECCCCCSWFDRNHETEYKVCLLRSHWL